MYTIEQREPEGWAKAFCVYRDGAKIATFRYLDDAQYFVARRARVYP